MPDEADSTTTITLSPDGTQLLCTGSWTISEVSHLTAELQSLSKRIEAISQVDADGITHMDSAGALMLSDVLSRLRKGGQIVNVLGLKNKFQALFTLVSHEIQQLRAKRVPPRKLPNFFHLVGEWAVDKYLQFLAFFAFIGELMVIILQVLAKPNRIQWRTTLKIMDEFGYRALPIIALMLFLIGVVLTYQLAIELKVYGADIFVVDVSGIAILREFGPLIAAIIMAGRTSTSFAALIGTMKVNEEIDALQVMGVSPIRRLVLPRIVGLIIVMPLLTVWANIFGIIGSMVMAKAIIGIHYYAFLERFQQMVALKQLVLGIVKTPVFAMIIATVGCFQGFQTEMSAESVGRRTTASAVQAIFLIIIADAGFSILYSVMGL